MYDSLVNGPFDVEVNVAPTPGLAREVIDNPVPLVRVVIGSPLYNNDIVILVVVGAETTKYGVPAVRPFVVLPNTITSFATNPCAEPVEIVLPVAIVVQVGVVPPLA